MLAVLIAALGWSASAAAAARAAPPTSGDTGVRDASGGTGSSQTEDMLAVDPANPDNAIIGYIGGCASVSHDGGLRWKNVNLAGGCEGDNNPAFDSRGVGYFELDNNGVQVYRSTDGGDHWSGPVTAVTPLDNNGDALDRPWLVADRSQTPSNGTLYVGWESFFTNPVGWVYVRSSTDGGTTWGPVHRVDNPANLPATEDPREEPVVGADGTLYVVYASGHQPLVLPQESPISFVVARSGDGGANFQRTVAAPDITRTSAPEEETEAISSLAADPSPQRARHLVLTWADRQSGESRILVVDSVDGGVTWSPSVDVADDPPGHGNQHDHPQAAFLPDGRVVLVWRDRRCCGGSFSDDYQLFARTLTLTSSGGLIPGRTVQMTTSPQQPNQSFLFNEYLGLAAGPEGVFAAWNQVINGVATSVFRRRPLADFSTAAACPLPPQRFANRTLGPITLDQRRGTVRHEVKTRISRRTAYSDTFCFSPVGIRVGYLPPAAAGLLSPRARRKVAGRVLLILTANQVYALKGVRPDSSLAAARRRLRLSSRIKAGANVWYLAPISHATGVLKVRRGRVAEVGIADPRLTRPRRLAVAFLSSF